MNVTVPHNGTDTSKAAAQAILPKLSEVLMRIHMQIIRSGKLGMTCDEIERELKLRHQTASARVRDLAQRGVIDDSGSRRATSSGRPAIVWVDQAFAPSDLEVSDAE